ncbi:SDR family NAD(P)-dependent oxidoreductase [Oceanicoccus sp. KOV_DT_Chl]|uniref:SDR family NAD(P)-dependent oxidoreductase n=1 Tax=Oceanicoccus sp. KOV_DT_Chl TaxID=1904639 RepID=UPI000C7CDC9A|nr:glucose 1-dehydrogenase [Oceanicoccus sp. KOV_DT_Chl]
MLLADKVALITGAGEGIGQATALMFAKDGAKVAVVDRQIELGQATADAINKEGGEAIFIAADVSQHDSIKKMVADCITHFGRLDCAVNNAARSASFALTADTEEQHWDLTQAVTLKGVWLCMKYQIPAMLKTGGGAIVNISSLAGIQGEVFQAPYAAAKAGVIGLTQTAAGEYAQQNIRVNAICPGGILTRGMANYLDKVPGAREKVEGTHAMRRLGKPEEIADAAAYLCSDRASFITGHPLIVDGGIMVNPYLL